MAENAFEQSLNRYQRRQQNRPESQPLISQNNVEPSLGSINREQGFNPNTAWNAGDSFSRAYNNFATSIWGPGFERTPNPHPEIVSQQKQEAVSYTSDVKKLAAARKAEQWAAATAAKEGNNLANTEAVQDAYNMSYALLVDKYGKAQADNLMSFKDTMLDMSSVENSSRNLTSDIPLGVGVGAVNLGTSVASLIGRAAEATVENSPLGYSLGLDITGTSAAINEAGNSFSRAISSMQSENAQDKAAQSSLRTQLNEADSAAQYEEDIQRLGTGIDASIVRMGRDFANEIVNLTKDPGMAGQVTAEALGSFIPVVKGTQIAGRAMALSAAMREGRDRVAAVAFLETQAGQRLIREKTIQIVPATAGLTEGAGGFSQAQMEVLSLTEQELLGNENYQALRSQGLSHEDAQLRLANMAGDVAFGVSGAIGMAAGNLARGFDAAPLQNLRGLRTPAAARTAVATTATESVEETIQEGGNTLGSNVGQIAAGFEKDVTEGVGTAGATGFVGGAGMTAATQTVPLATGAVRDAGEAAVDSLVDATNARLDRQEAEANDTSTTGTTAIKTASEQAGTAINAIETAPDLAQEEQELGQIISEGSRLNPESSQGYVKAYPKLAAAQDDQGRLPITYVVPAIEQDIRNAELQVRELTRTREKLEKEINRGKADQNTINSLAEVNAQLEDAKITQTQESVAAIELFSQAEKLISEDVTQRINNLSNDSKNKALFDPITEKIRTVLGSETLTKAKAHIESLSRDDVLKAFPVANLDQQTTDPAQAQSMMEAVTLIAQFNPVAMPVEETAPMLSQDSTEDGNQDSGTTAAGIDKNSTVYKKFKEAHAAASAIQNSTFTADRNEAAYEAAEALKNGDIVDLRTGYTAKLKERVQKTGDQVRQEALVIGNRDNDGLSAAQHRSKVLSELAAGNTIAVEDLMTDMSEFAGSLTRKVEALNQSFRNGDGNGVQFEAYNPNLKVRFRTDLNDSPYVQIKSNNSIKNAKMVKEDADVIIDTYNNLVDVVNEQLGETKFDKLENPALDDGIQFRDKQGNVIKELVNRTTPNQRTFNRYQAAVQEGRTRRERIQKSPLTEALKSVGVIPGSPIGQRLMAEGITPQKAPGLFRKAADPVKASTWDNITINDLGDTYKDAIANDGITFDTDALVAGLAQEVFDGVPVRVGRQQELVDEKALREAERRKRQARQTKVPRPRPLIDELIIAGVTLDPNGSGAKEIFDNKFSKKDVPGLIKKGGRVDLDTVERGTSAYLDELIPPAENPVYYDRQALLDAVLSEANGTAVRNSEEEALAQAERDAVAAEQEAELEATEAAYDEALRAEANTETATEVEPTVDENVVTPSQTTSEQETPADENQSDENTSEDENVTEEPSETPVSTDVESVLQKALIKTKEGVNYLLKAFKFSNETTTLLNEQNPLGVVRQRLTDLTDAELDALTEVEKLSAKVTKDVTEGLNKFLNKTSKVGKARAEKLNIKPGSELSLLQAIEEFGEDGLKFRSAMAANFASYNEEAGQYEIDERFVQAAVMATVEFATLEAARGGGRRWDRQRLARLFRIEEEQIDPKVHYPLARKGTPVSRVLDDVSAKTQRLTGFKPIKGESATYTQGVFKGLAAVTLSAVNKEAFWFKVNNEKNQGNYEPVRKINWHTVNVNNQAPLFKKLGKRTSVFSEAFLGQKTKLHYVGQPIDEADLKTTRQGQSNVKLSREERAVQKRASRIKNYLTPVYDVYIALGDEFKNFIGFEQINRSAMNINDFESQSARNEQISRSLESINRYRQIAEEQDSNYRNVPIFFDWVFTRVGRFMQVGPVTPQADKTARILLSPTKSSLDLTNDNHWRALNLAIAQNLGASIEKMTIQETLDFVENADVQYKQSIAGMAQLIKDGKIDDPKALLETFRAEDVSRSPEAFNAIYNMAKLLVFLENDPGAQGKFETFLSIEFDGKTDGPINAMVNMGTGAFTAQQIEILAKGGLFFGSETQVSLTDYITGGFVTNKDTEQDQDLYNVAAANLTMLLNDRLAEAGPEEKTAITQTYKLITALMRNPVFGNINYDETGTPVDAVIESDTDKPLFKIARNFVKNPLTVFIYGAGQTGIAGKIASTMEDGLYNIATEIAASKQRAREHPAIKNTDFVESLAQAIEITPQQLLNRLNNAQAFALSEAEKKSLANAVNEAIGTELTQAIDMSVGGLREKMQIIQFVSNFQAAAAADYYERRVREAEAAMPNGELPSEETYQQILSEASKIGPNYYNDDQDFDIASADQVIGTGEYVAESFEGTLSGNARTTALRRDIGVTASPSMVQGTGDARMINKAYADETNTGLDKSTPVYDGIEGALEAIAKMAIGINQGVHQSWQSEGIASMVLKSYKETLRRTNDGKDIQLGSHTQKFLEEFVKSNQSGIKEGTPAEFLAALEQMVDENTARQRAMAKTKLWIDHMAGAQAPYESSGSNTFIADGQTYN